MREMRVCLKSFFYIMVGDGVTVGPAAMAKTFPGVSMAKDARPDAKRAIPYA